MNRDRRNRIGGFCLNGLNGGAGKCRPLLGVAAGLVAGSAWAQSSPAPAAAVTDTSVEEVVVTGSRVTRNGYDTPTPVTVINEGEIQAGAPVNLADYVNQLPSVAGSTAPSNSNRSLSSGAAGISSINLRSLGNARTLVLLDGRRSVGSLAQGTVDINTFPQGLVKSIEVVTGGASATYGSDAVSGIVNFILDKDYSGFKGTVEGGETTYGDDRSWNATLTGGIPFAAGRGHILLNGQMSRRDGIYGMPRDWAQQGWHMVNNPDYVAGNGAPEYRVASQSGQSVMTAGGIITDTELRGTYFGIGGVVNQFAYGETRDPWTIGGDWQLGESNGRTSLEPESQRDGVFTRLSYALGDRLEVFGELSWNENRARQWGGAQSEKGSVTIQADNAFLPESVAQRAAALGITEFRLGTFNADIPTRITDNTRTVERYVLGLDGDFSAWGADWQWDAYYQRGETQTNETLLTTHSGRLREAQDAVFDPDSGAIVCRSTLSDPGNGCVPYNRFGIGVNDDEALSYFLGRPERDQRFQQDVAAINFSTSIANPWLEPIGIAFGAEHRREEISGDVEEQYQSGWTYGNYLPTFGDYHVSEAYFEALLVMPKGLEFNGAVRGTDYSTSGFVTTWKAGLSWTPTPDLRLRLTQSRDIRAPNLEELYQAGRRRTNFVTDPFYDNVSTRFTEDTTGNLDLVPEKADSLGLGLIYRPGFLPGFGLSLDYYDIEIEDAISMVSAQDIVNRCYDGNPTFCDAFYRLPESDSGIDIYLNNSPFNFVAERARGLDIELSYVFALADLHEGLRGTLSLRALATHYLEMSSDNGVDPPTDTAGQNTSGGPPDWMYRLTAAYTLDRFNFSLIGRGLSAGTYNNSYIECSSGCPASSALNRTIDNNRIAGAFYIDTYFAWNVDIGTWQNQFFFKITNLLNEDPEVVGLGPGDSSNVEPGVNRTLYDYLGRVFRVGLRFEWGA